MYQRPYTNRDNVRQWSIWSKQRGGTIQDVRGTYGLKFYGYCYMGDFWKPHHGTDMTNNHLAKLIVRQTIGNGTYRNTGARRNLLNAVSNLRNQLTAL
jgi:hypothetical protein